MPQVSTITVNDRETTPVAHALAPVKRDSNGAWTFVEPSSDGSYAKATMVLRVVPAAANQPLSRNRVELRLIYPTMVEETINGVVRQTPVRESAVDVGFRFDKASTTQERKNLVGMIANSLAASQTMIDAVLADKADLY